MANERPFLGETTDREDAFGEYESIEISIEQDVYGAYAPNTYAKTRTFTKETMQRHLSCVNPRCQQGGLDLQKLIWSRDSGSYEHKYDCSGHEGSPKGRRKGDPCRNAWNIKIEIQKKN